MFFFSKWKERQAAELELQRKSLLTFADALACREHREANMERRIEMASLETAAIKAALIHLAKSLHTGFDRIENPRIQTALEPTMHYLARLVADEEKQKPVPTPTDEIVEEIEEMEMLRKNG
jgi:hypothetical protein